MRTNFFDIQAGEGRKIAALATLAFLCYFALFFTILWAIRTLIFGGNPFDIGPASLFAFALAAGILGLQMWFADRYGVQSILETLSARAPDVDDDYHQRLARIVEELSIAAGLPRPPRVVIAPTLACNGFALSDSRQMILGATEGMVSTLNRDQTQAVMAHEMSHLLNQDCRLATWICAMAAPILSMAETLERLSEDDNPQTRGAPFGAAARMIVTIMTVALSRHRETRADARAVELTRNPLALAEALFRLSRANHFVVGGGESMSPMFILPSSDASLSESEGFLADLFSSHPPTQKRLAPLLAMAGADIDVMAENIDKRPSVAPASPFEASAASAGERWSVRVSTGWTGPMTLLELMKRSDVGPQSWTRRAGEEGAGRPAMEEPALKRLLRARESGEKPIGGPCPRCGLSLALSSYEGTPIGICPDRHGALAETSRVQRILARRDVRFTGEFLRKAMEWSRANNWVRLNPDNLAPAETADPCPCPGCGALMLRRNYTYQYFVQVDRCHSCHVIWFDTEELELLQALVELKMAGGRDMGSQGRGVEEA